VKIRSADPPRAPSTSEYDTVLSRPPSAADLRDLDLARELFTVASRRYLGSPWPWLGWALILPATALVTPAVASAFDDVGTVLLWSSAILLGGVVEALSLRHGERGGQLGGSGLATWAFRVQANLSLAAVVLSAALIFAGAVALLPGLWLLCLGHSLYTLGGLAFAPMRQAGLIYQLGGVAALLPGVEPLLLFAAATFVANLYLAVGVARRRSLEAP